MTFDWKNPDYAPILADRAARLARLRASPATLTGLREHYRERPADFIDHWCNTFDPRNADRKLPTTIPFVLFDRQRALVEWIVERWRSGEPGIVEKSRDSGVSWLAVAIAAALCLFNDGLVIGFGSRKEEYVDRIGDMKSIFQKLRFVLNGLPPEFKGAWDPARHAPHMRIFFPTTDSICTGECGDGIGRGDRTSLHFIDESAHLDRPELIEASLSGTTRCRIDISTPYGMANPFARRRHGGRSRYSPSDGAMIRGRIRPGTTSSASDWTQ